MLGGHSDTSFSGSTPVAKAPFSVSGRHSGGSGRGEATTARALDAFARVVNRLFILLPGASSCLVLVYYNLIFCNISRRKLSFPSSYSILPLNSV